MKKNRQPLGRRIWSYRASYVMLAPFMLIFLTFTIFPVVASVVLSFTRFNVLNAPVFIGLTNYTNLFFTDEIFSTAVGNTVVLALITGPLGYFLCFFFAWVINDLPHRVRSLLTLVFYAPSIAGNLFTIWLVIFDGDIYGYLNSLLLQLGIIQTPITWLQSPETLMPVMILVALWSSFDVGFLSMLSGMLNVNKEIYEAAHLDGIRNRIQEIIYVTIPSIRPQMLFGAVMALVGTFNSAGLGVQLSGSNPTPQYAGSLIVNHVDDFGFIRYEMGYAAALSVVLLLIISLCSKLAYKLFGDN